MPHLFLFSHFRFIPFLLHGQSRFAPVTGTGLGVLGSDLASGMLLPSLYVSPVYRCDADIKGKRSISVVACFCLFPLFTLTFSSFLTSYYPLVYPSSQTVLSSFPTFLLSFIFFPYSSLLGFPSSIRPSFLSLHVATVYRTCYSPPRLFNFPCPLYFYHLTFTIFHAHMPFSSIFSFHRLSHSHVFFSCCCIHYFSHSHAVFSFHRTFSGFYFLFL